MIQKCKTGFYYSPKYLDHRPSPTHPESPHRLKWIVEDLQLGGLWENLLICEPQPADLKWIEQIHSFEYLKRIHDDCNKGKATIDSLDVEVSFESYDVAVLAVGGVLKAVDAVVTGELDNAFCAVRPPGHHAMHDKAMGFCLFNNIAIAAKYAQLKYGLEHILIVDWDVHHGNGTQAAFYGDPTVFYFSTHQYPHYPGTGAAEETGMEMGKGYTLNVPMPAFSTDDDYRRAFDEKLIPAAETFQPKLVLISAGFDAHADDPLSNIKLTDGCFGELTEIVKDIAEQWAKGRIVSVLEGGYHPTGLPRSVAAHLKVFIN